MPPLGIGYLSSIAKREKFEVDIIDLAKREIKLRRFGKILKEKNYDVIGLSISTPNYQTALKTAKIIREASPKSIFIIGGPHPSAFIERSLKEFNADYLFQRESEMIFPRFLKAVAEGREPTNEVPSVFALRDDKLVGISDSSMVEDLDSLPFPDWDSLMPHTYPPIPHQMFVRKMPVAPMLTTRGCPMNCTFCATTYLFGEKLRKRSPKNVIEELSLLRDKFKIKEVHFEDDNPTFDKNHSKQLFEAIIKANLGLIYKFPNGIMPNTLDSELLSLMHKAGVYQISLGIETCADETLDKEKKYVPYEDIYKVVSEAKKVGLEVQGLFVVGLPYDTPNGVKQTVKRAIEMKLDLAHFGVFIPIPGSKLGERLAGIEIRAINFFTPFVEYQHISPKKLKSLQRWAILKFYLRPRPIFKLLKMMRLKQIPGVLNVARRYILGL